MIIAVRMQVCILLCVYSISTHLIPAITYLHGIGADLCGQATCIQSYDTFGADIVGDLCLKSINYSTNQRCIGCGLGGQPTMQMAEPEYCF